MNKLLYIGVFSDATADRYRLNGMRQAGINVLQYDYRKGIQNNPRQFLSTIIAQTRQFDPDLVFVNGGDTFTPAMINQVKKVTPNAKWLLWDGNPREKMRDCLIQSMKYYDAVLLPSDDPEENEKYKRHGARKVFYHHQVVDHLLFKRTPLKPVYDIVFFGANYNSDLFPHSKRRREFLTKLVREFGDIYKIKFYGGGWGKDINLPVFGKDFVRAASEAKIILGFQAFNNIQYYTSDRTFMCMACGFYLADVWKGAGDMFEDEKHLKFFTTYEEMIDNIDKYIDDAPARMKIHLQGRKLIETKYNFRKRAEELKDIFKELKN